MIYFVKEGTDKIIKTVPPYIYNGYLKYEIHDDSGSILGYTLGVRRGIIVMNLSDLGTYVIDENILGNNLPKDLNFINLMGLGYPV